MDWRLINILPEDTGQPAYCRRAETRKWRGRYAWKCDSAVSPSTRRLYNESLALDNARIGQGFSPRKKSTSCLSRGDSLICREKKKYSSSRPKWNNVSVQQRYNVTVSIRVVGSAFAGSSESPIRTYVRWHELSDDDPRADNWRPTVRY